MNLPLVMTCYCAVFSNSDAAAAVPAVAFLVKNCQFWWQRRL